MAEHGFYLGMSYAAAALAIVAELIALKVGRARALKHVEEERELEAQD
jgi:heme exporter protein CcmD